MKLQAVRDALDRAGVPAKAEVIVELKPWERLIGDLAGIATISREQHLALGSAPVIDAELVEPDAVDRPSDPPREMPPDDGYEAERPSSPPGMGLTTLEEAVIMDEQHRAARKWQW